MQQEHMQTLQTFDIDSLPDLDVCVLAALELFAQEKDEKRLRWHDMPFKRPLVVGSGNAAATGKVLFDDTAALFADENNYRHQLATYKDIDGAVLISASGGKHSIEIARDLQEHTVPTFLLTHNADAPAKRHVHSTNVVVFPKNREPYTYNTSTYLGPIFAKTQEDPQAVRQFICKNVLPKLPENLADYHAFCLIVPKRFLYARDMIRTKFDELFGAEVSGRVFTVEEIKHAKTVVPSGRECFISFGEEAEVKKLVNPMSPYVHIPLPETTSYASMLAIAYYTVGRIQAAHPPYFKKNIVAYTKHISSVFNQNITPIVE